MTTTFVRVCLGLLAVVPPLSVTHTQQVSAAGSQSVASDLSARVLQRTVTVHLDKASARLALEKIAGAAHVRLQYDDVVLALIKTPVSLDAKKMPLGIAIGHVLSGTQLQVVPLARDVIGIGLIDAAMVQGVVQGKVINAKTKQPVTGATVFVGDPKSGVLSGADGSFRIAVAEGEYQVTVRAVGFVRHTQSVVVRDGQTVTLEVGLEPSASVLDEVVVTGSVVATERKSIPYPITVITADDIEKRGITRIEQLMHGEIPGVIALDVGIKAYNDELGGMVTSQVYSRGSSGLTASASGGATPLKTFIDGVELFDPSYLGTIDPRSIERIEVVTGPQAATIYGAGALGGVMQIFTKKGAGQANHNLTANFRYGMLQSSFSPSVTPAHNHSVGMDGGVGSAFSYSTTVSYDYVGQWQPDLYSRRIGGTIGIASKIQAITVNGSVSMSATSNGSSARLYSVGGYSPATQQKIMIGEWMPVNLGGRYTRRESKTSNLTLALNAHYQMKRWWQHSATMGKSQNHFALVPQAAAFATPSDTLFRTGESNSWRTSWGYNTTASASVGGVLTSIWTLGASGANNGQSRFNACSNTEFATSLVGCGPSGQSSTVITKDLDNASWGGFVNWRLGVWDQMFFTFGLRGQQDRSYGGDHGIDWTPRYGVTYSMAYRDLTVKLLGSYGRATRSPRSDARQDEIQCGVGIDPRCFVVRIANPFIGPERSGGPQGGVELYWGNRGSFSVNHYQQRVTGLLQNIFSDSLEIFVRGTLETLPQMLRQWHNFGTIRQYGWESTGMLTLGSITLDGTYSWNEARIEKMTLNALGFGARFHEGGAFSTIPPHVANVRMTYAYGRTSISLDGTFIGRSLRTTVDLRGPEAYYNDRHSRLKIYSSGVDRNAGNAYVAKSGYSKGNLSVSHQLNRLVTLSLLVSNLGNSFASDAEDGLWYPTLGRKTTIGMSLRHPMTR